MTGSSGKILRLVFAVLLLCAVLYSVGVRDLIGALSQLTVGYIVVLLVLSFILIWASALKWRLFVRASGHNPTVLHLMKLYTIGYFFNSFIPSYIGGDVARSFHLGKHLHSHKDAFLATFLERYTGLLAMSLLGALFVALGSEAASGVELAILIVAVGAIGLGLVCYSEFVNRIFLGIVRLALRTFGLSRFISKLNSFSEKFEHGMKSLRTDHVLFFKALVYSLLFHTLSIVNTYITAKAVGWENPNFAGLFVVVPLVLLVGMAPVTPSGLGLQEGAFVFFLCRIGATKPQGLGVALVLRAKMLIIALIGWFLWLGIRKEKRGGVIATTETLAVELEP